MKTISDRVITMGFTRQGLLSVIFLGTLSTSAMAAPQVTYVGLGRYSCSGSTAECAQINFNNLQVEENNRRRYQEEQERAQRYIEESRRRGRERRENCTNSGPC